MNGKDNPLVPFAINIHQAAANQQTVRTQYTGSQAERVCFDTCIHTPKGTACQHNLTHTNIDRWMIELHTVSDLS